MTDHDEIEQTLAGMVEAFDTNYIVGVREEPRLTEQQFGNFQNLATIVESKAERARFGRFYYRCGAVGCVPMRAPAFFCEVFFALAAERAPPHFGNAAVCSRERQHGQ